MTHIEDRGPRLSAGCFQASNGYMCLFFLFFAYYGRAGMATGPTRRDFATDLVYNKNSKKYQNCLKQHVHTLKGVYRAVVACLTRTPLLAPLRDKPRVAQSINMIRCRWKQATDQKNCLN